VHTGTVTTSCKKQGSEQRDKKTKKRGKGREIKKTKGDKRRRK
jgi:hypothetical protein